MPLFFGAVFKNRGVAQPGSAPGWGPGGRRFKSSRPDQHPCQKFIGVFGFPAQRSQRRAFAALQFTLLSPAIHSVHRLQVKVDKLSEFGHYPENISKHDNESCEA